MYRLFCIVPNSVTFSNCILMTSLSPSNSEYLSSEQALLLIMKDTFKLLNTRWQGGGEEEKGGREEERGANFIMCFQFLRLVYLCTCVLVWRGLLVTPAAFIIFQCFISFRA